MTLSPMEPLWSTSKITVHLLAAVVVVRSKNQNRSGTMVPREGL